jgi:diaminopimelate decarboxylase
MTAVAGAESRLRLTPPAAFALAATFGTPLYVLDETIFREKIRRYRRALAESWPRSEISYASKANSTLAVLRIAHQEGCRIDVASEGELRAALVAGVPASECHLHGNNKSDGELEFAVQQGIGMVMADNTHDLERLAELDAAGRVRVVLRLAPGVDPQTNPKISTGQTDTKFGFSLDNGAAHRAVEWSLRLGLNLVGFHCHVGSQLLNPNAQLNGGRRIAEFAAEIGCESGRAMRYLNVGGGLGVDYGMEAKPLPIEDYCRQVADAVREALGELAEGVTLAHEPGRSLIAEAGCTLYRVGVVKQVPAATPTGARLYVAVDGGLSDNPRPAMYGARYPVEILSEAAHRPAEKPESQLATICGKHCETDNLFVDVPVPEDVAPGDLLQVGVTGAYNASMASNYNRFARPATVLRRANGEPALIQERESYETQLARERIPEDL